MRVSVLWALTGGAILADSSSVPARTAEPVQDGRTVTLKTDEAKFVGSMSCQSSMCHGGASSMRRQGTIWLHEDAHSHAYATLTTAYSALIAEALHIRSAASNMRCIKCHAPLGATASFEPSQMKLIAEGVTCEACHGPAEAWLRSHTRLDYTYTQRVSSGMKDLRDVHTRATTCVGCHQVLPNDILRAGHPALTFEMDGQTALEPPHWEEKASWFGPQAWVIGQVVALHEISKEICEQDEPSNRAESPLSLATDGQAARDKTAALQALFDQQNALKWLLTRVPDIQAGVDLKNVGALSASRRTEEWSDQLAKSISKNVWSPSMTRLTLKSLLATSDDFLDSKITKGEHFQRSVRLLMGIDRLTRIFSDKLTRPDLSEVSSQTASLDEFNPQGFSVALKKLAARLNPEL